MSHASAPPPWCMIGFLAVGPNLVSAEAHDLSGQALAAPMNGLLTPSYLGKLMLLPTLQCFLLSSMLWTVVLLGAWALPCVSLRVKKQGADRVMSAVHSLVSFALGLAAEISFEPSCRVGDTWLRAALQVTLGYLTIDAVSMMVCDVWKRWRPIDYTMLVHHFFIIICFGLGTMYDAGVFFAVSLMVNEASTPVVQLLWYLRFTHRKDTRCYFVTGVVMVLAFFVSRMLFIPYSFYQFASLNFCIGQGGDFQWLFWVMIPNYFFVYALNTFWFVKMAQGSLKKLRGIDDQGKGTILESVEASSLSHNMSKPVSRRAEPSLQK